MASPSKTCSDQLLKSKHTMDLVVGMNWIIVREYKRVNEFAEDVQIWDLSFRHALDAYQSTQSTEELDSLQNLMTDAAKTFVSNVQGLAKSPAALPGWNDSTCSMDWKEFACFCNWAASQPPGHLVSLTNAVTPGEKIVYSCEPAVRSDAKYSETWPKPDLGPSSRSSTWMWAAGAAAVVALGVGAYAYSRKQNPAPGDTKAAYWRGKRVQLHPGTDRWMMGDRYGEVVGVSKNGKLKIRLDKSGQTISLPESRVQEI